MILFPKPSLNDKLDLKQDYVFKRIFSKPENNEALKDLLEAILNIKIKTIQVKNPELPKNYSLEKLGILDIRAYVNNDTILDIEMQMHNVSTIVHRNISYSSKIIAEQLQVNEDYMLLKKFISINFLGENLLNRDTYHSIVHLKFEDIEPEKYVEMNYDKQQDVLTNLIEFHYIELKKFLKKNPEICDKLNQWLYLLCGKGDKIKMISKDNKSIEKVTKELEEMSMDENERLEAYKARLAEWEYNYTMAKEKADGIAEGEAKGEARGIAQGIKAGKLEKQKEIAKNMKNKGMDNQSIAELTGLSLEEIEKI